MQYNSPKCLVYMNELRDEWKVNLSICFAHKIHFVAANARAFAHFYLPEIDGRHQTTTTTKKMANPKL